MRERRGAEASSSYSGPSVELLSVSELGLTREFHPPMHWVASEQRKIILHGYTAQRINVFSWLQEPNDLTNPLCYMNPPPPPHNASSLTAYLV